MRHAIKTLVPETSESFLHQKFDAFFVFETCTTNMADNRYNKQHQPKTQPTNQTLQFWSRACTFLAPNRAAFCSVSGPTVWNSLPAALRLDMSLSVFRARLKTFLMT